MKLWVSLTTAFLVICVPLVFIHCGKKSSDDSSGTPTTTMTTAQQTDTAKIFTAVSGALTAAGASSAGLMNLPKCPSTVNGCSVTCSGGVMTATCDGTVTSHYTCDSTTYTFDHMAATVTVDYTNFSITSGGTISFSETVAGNVTGGSLTSATAFACQMGSTLTFSSITATPTNALDCSNFSCTLGGQAITCDDMTAAIKANTCKTTSGGTGAAPSSTPTPSASPSSSSCPTSIKNACYKTTAGMCTDFIATAADCTGSTAESSCASAGAGTLVYSCHVGSGTAADSVMRFYSPTFTAATAAVYCASGTPCN